MKYKKGDDIYLKGRITDVSSCSEVSFPYEVNTADEFINVREEDIASVNEPEKPVVPPCIDRWIQGCKYNGFDLLEAMTLIDGPEEIGRWISDNPETFAKAWLYGYEVKKEKMYVVFQVATEEYLYTNDFGKLRSACVSYASVEESEEYHFTQQKLEELNYWKNPAFEVKEVNK